MAYQTVTERQLVPLKFINDYRTQLYPDCICDYCDFFNMGSTGHCYYSVPDENEEDGYRYEEADEVCPVCSAWRRCRDTGNFTSDTYLKIVKLDKDLNVLSTFTMPTGTGIKNPENAPMPYAIDVNDKGDIFVSGASQVDFLKNYAPALSFSYFKTNSTPDAQYQPAAEKARGFIIRIDGDMTGVKASTYLGGMRLYNSFVGGESFVASLAHDSTAVYAGGGDYSGKIPTHESALQPAHAEIDRVGSPTTDAFIAKLDPETLQVMKATYYGGGASDYICKLVVKDGVVYAGGSTVSNDLKVSDDACQKKLQITGSASYNDCFLLRVSSDLSADDQFAATYLGGTAREDLYDIDVDASGSVYLTGKTYNSSGYPTTDNSSTSGTYFISAINDKFNKLLHSSLVTEGYGRVVRADDGQIIAGGMVVEDGAYHGFIQSYSPSLSHSDIDTVRSLEFPASSEPVYIGSGDVNIAVTFTSPVKVTGTPRILLNVKGKDGENRYAVYREPTDEQKETELYKNTGNGTKKLIFTYTVQEGDSTDGSRLDTTPAEAVDLNGGTIVPRSASGSDVQNMGLTLPVGTRGLTWSNIYINTVPQTVQSVTCDLPSGTYGVRTVVPLRVKFSGSVNDVVSREDAKIYIELNNGGRAYYDHIDEATGELIFHYTVSADDQSVEKLSYTGGIVIPGGSYIRDAYGIAADSALPAADRDTPMGKVIKVDLQAASIIGVTADKEPGYYKKGDIITITVKFNKKITTTGEAYLALNVMGGISVTAPAVTDSDTLTFSYAVNKENTMSGVYLDYASLNALTLAEGAEAAGAGGETVSLVLPEPGGEGSLSESRLLIDTQAPVVSRTDRNSTASGYYKLSKFYKAGEKLVLEAQFNEEVFVREGAVPYVQMECSLGDEPLRLTYEGQGMTKRSLVFSYMVKDGDTINNATMKNTTTPWSIFAGAGDITDTAGNAADLSLLLPYSAGNIWADIYFDTDAPVWPQGDAAIQAVYTAAEKKMTLTWTEPVDQTSGLASDKAYIIYRDGAEIAQTAWPNYEDSDVTPGIHEYQVCAVDKAGNLSEPLKVSCTSVAEDRYSVDVTGSDKMTADNTGEIPQLTVQTDGGGTDGSGLNFGVTVAPADTDAVIGKGRTITVLWTQMRSNRMIAWGTKQLTAKEAAASLSDTVESDSVKLQKGDVIKVFVTEDPVSAAAGEGVFILNGRK